MVKGSFVLKLFVNDSVSNIPEEDKVHVKSQSNKANTQTLQYSRME